MSFSVSVRSPRFVERRGVTANQAPVAGIQVEPFGVQSEGARQVPRTTRVPGELGPERQVVRMGFEQAFEHRARLVLAA